MDRAIDELVEKTANGGVAVFFFAGHGVQVGGANFLLPIDLRLSAASDLTRDAIDLGSVMDRLARAKTKFALLVIDACRDNPFAKATAGSTVASRGVRASVAPRGLTMPSSSAAPDGLIILYSAGINEQALDRLSERDTDPNGLFTREFVKQLKAPWRRVDDMLRRVRVAVREQAIKVGHAQNPALYDQSSDYFYLVPEFAGTQADRSAYEASFWESIVGNGREEDFRSYLEQFPNGRFASLARSRLQALPAQAAARPQQLRVGVFKWRNESILPTSVRAVLMEDLRRVDEFAVEEIDRELTSDMNSFDFDKWRTTLDVAVVADARVLPDGRFEIRFRTLEAKSRTQMRGFAFITRAEQLRATGHVIADVISGAATGSTGVFNAQIAYVSKDPGNRYELNVAHADGREPQMALRSFHPIQSARWSPNGKRIAYLSFEHAPAPPGLYVHDLATGRRTAIAAKLNPESLIAWSADGNRLVVAEPGAPGGRIYSVSLADQSSSPIAVFEGSLDDLAVGPDGSIMILTKERRQGSAIYALSADGNKERIDVPGEGSVTNLAVLAGGRLAVVMAARGKERLFLFDRNTRQLKELVQGDFLKSVSWSPDGRLLALVREEAGKSQPVLVTLAGNVHSLAVPVNSTYYEIAWGPYDAGTATKAR
jgi:TolB protein